MQSLSNNDDKYFNGKEYAILDDKYALIKKIGSGATCKVKLAKEKGSNEIVAVKVLTPSQSKQLNSNSKHFLAEVEMLKKVNHENIINLKDGNKGVIKKPDGRTKIVDYIVLEYAGNGELFDYLYFPRKGLGEKMARYIFKQLINGLEACHLNGVAHRDLKTENLMMNNDWILKIADFGYATLLAGKSGNGLLTTFLGTLSYAAPEILNKKPYIGSCADIFSCGVILFVLVTGKLPFGKAVVFDSYYKNFIRNDYEAFWATMGPKIEPVSDDFKSLINLLLAFDPTQRPSISEIKSHSWMLKEEPSKSEVFEDFEKRKLIVTQMKELEAQEEAKKKKGGRPGAVYRSGGGNNDDDGELLFKEERRVDDWDCEEISNTPYKMKVKGNSDYMSLINNFAKYFEKDERPKEITPSENVAKFKVIYEADEELVKNFSQIVLETLSFEVELRKIDDESYIVLFNKLSGDKLEFFNTFDQFVEFIEAK
jgi:serine/threonine protein kinase